MLKCKSEKKVCLFPFYPTVTRKRWWRYILDESAKSAPAELTVSEFSGCLTSCHWICCLFEAITQR